MSITDRDRRQARHRSGGTRALADSGRSNAPDRALARLAARYEQIIATLKEVVFQTDAAGLWTYLNPAWSEITGFALDESLGQSFLGYVHPDDRERNQALFAPLVNREKDYCRHQVRYLTADGGFRWIEVHAQLIVDEDGTITGTSGTLRDVTEARDLHDKISYRERFERLLMTVSNDFVTRSAEQMDAAVDEALASIGAFVDVDRSYVFRFDATGAVMDNTHEWCAPGTSAEKDNLQGIPCDALPAWMAKLLAGESIYVPEVAALSEGWAAERAILEPQGIRSLVVVPMAHGGRLRGFVGFDSVRKARVWTSDELGLLRVFGELLANALARHEQDEELRRRQAYLDAILDNQPNLAWLKDAEGRFLLVNENFARSCGRRSAAELVGLGDHDIWPVDRAARYLADDLGVMRRGQTMSVEEPIDDGTGRRWLETFKTVVRDSAGRVLGTTGLSRDVTERHRAEERLSQANADLAAANRLLEDEKRNLEMFHEAAVDQEMVVIDLKREVNALLARLGEAEKYSEINEIDELLRRVGAGGS